MKKVQDGPFLGGGVVEVLRCRFSFDCRSDFMETSPHADHCAPGGRIGEGKAQRLFERVAAPMGGRNVAWQPSGSRGQSSAAAVSAAALTGPRVAALPGVP